MNIYVDKKTCISCGACAVHCPAGAISKREDGLVLIDPDTCIGCSQCKEACPYDAIYFNEELGICQKCTGCAHLLDHGHSLPRCVDACPTDALRFGEEDELRDLIEGATVRDPESGCGPRVYYRNIPGRFIAGTVYDPVEKEVVIGAKCVLTGGGQTLDVSGVKAREQFGDAFPAGFVPFFRILFTPSGMREHKRIFLCDSIEDLTLFIYQQELRCGSSQIDTYK